jgi:hypothetical protein
MNDWQEGKVQEHQFLEGHIQALLEFPTPTILPEDLEHPLVEFKDQGTNYLFQKEFPEDQGSQYDSSLLSFRKNVPPGMENQKIQMDYNQADFFKSIPNLKDQVPSTMGFPDPEDISTSEWF